MRCVCDQIQVKGQSVKCAACVLSVGLPEGQASGGTSQATPRQVSQEGKVSGSFQGIGSGEASRTLDTSEVWATQDELTSEEVMAFMTQEEMEACEAKAKGLLENRDFKHSSCEELLDMLPLKPILKHRRMLGNQRSVYVTFGVYAYGSHYGITHRTRSHQCLCRYLNMYMENHAGPFCRTSLTLSFNNQMPVHRDVNNDERFDNVVIGLGSFQKGGLWLQDDASESSKVSEQVQKRQLPSGEWVSGVIHDLRHKAQRFSPKRWHGSQEWIGNRVVIAAYVSRGIHHLSLEDFRRLKDFGFNCPPQENKHMSCAVEGVANSRDERKEEEQIMKKLHLLHAATGHGSVRTMLDTLKRRGVSSRVLEIAKRFRCSVCAERQRPPPRNLSSLETLPPKWRTVSADIGHWTHPRTGVASQFMLVIDEGSRFRVARVLTQGSKQQPTAAACLAYFQEGWAQVFGHPEVLRLDPSGSFRSEAVETYCDKHSIYLDVVPADAHWHIGVCEQAIKGVKHLMDRLCADDDRLATREALALAIETFNCREQIRGFTPVQHAFGRNPDVTGRLINRPDQVPDELLVESADADFERSAHARASAEKALADWQAQQRINRAMNSRSRPAYDYGPGELVFFWRTQESGSGRHKPGTSRGRFLGPARILATETKRDRDGTPGPGSTVWLVRGRSLLKCCAEQLRRASPREELLESLAHSTGQESTPWTFNRVVEEIGGNRFEDISSEAPDVREWARAQDPDQEMPPSRFRVRGKRAEPEGVDEEQLPQSTSEPSASSRPVRPRTRGPQALLEEPGQAWWNNIEPDHFGSFCGFWTDEANAIEIEIAMPESRNGRQKAAEHLGSYFVGALKRQAVEVNERRLNEQDKQAFKDAKSIEVKNFIASQAFEALPPEYKPDRSQAIGMRWVLTWKLRDDGSRKAKARAVLLGYQDPAYEHRATTAPVMCRQARQLLLQVAANRQWSVFKGDVSGAFLQGRDYPDQLLCAPCDEICEAMNLPRQTIVRLRKACYGLVDAPLEWYKTVATFLAELGFQRLWSDACTWTLRSSEDQLLGVISGHVDDFLFTGEETNAQWRDAIQKIQSRFKWGDWDKDDFVQCGVQVTREGAGFKLSQKRYVEAIPEIPVNSVRRKDPKAPTTERERTQLRGLLGALSWHAQQVAPHVSASVGLLLTEVTQSTVQTLLQANTLLSHVKSKSGHEMHIHSFPAQEALGMYAWVDAASQNRVDGGSSQGILVGLGPLSMLQGEVGSVSIIAWHANKIDRKCRSPGAAETQAAVNGEDVLYFARYHWDELIHGSPNPRDPDASVRRIPGTLITDSRNVYDKLQTEVLTINGAEKKSNIELISVKESQYRTSLQIRWIHSEAQLANSLTKWNGGHELELFYKMRSSWRIVEDPEMKSARRRKAEGLSPLQQQQQQQLAQSSVTSVESSQMGEAAYLLESEHNWLDELLSFESPQRR